MVFPSPNKSRYIDTLFKRGKKIVSKSLIEDKVISTCLSMLTKDNCKYIASQMIKYCNADGSNLTIKNLKNAIKSIDTAIEHLWQSLESGESNGMVTDHINARMAEKEKLLIELEEEESKCVSLSEEQILAFLDYVMKLPADDINKRRAIINIFVNAIYLYDDHFDIVFNASNQMMEIKDIPIDDIETALSGCSDALHKSSSIRHLAPPAARCRTRFENKILSKLRFYIPTGCLIINILLRQKKALAIASAFFL